MPISVSNQAHIFLSSVLGGMLIAFIYDAFRIKRKAIKTNSIITYIEDLIYWIIVALVMFGVVYYSNDGEIRGYIFIGTFIGVVLYILVLSKYVIKTAMFTLRLIYRIIKTTIKILIYPFKVIINILKVPAKFIARLVVKALKKAKRIRKNILAKTAMWKKIFKNIRKKI